MYLFVFSHATIYSCNICDSNESEPSILETELFQNLTLKTQGQGHGWSDRSRSYNWSNILLIHIHFIPCQLGNHSWVKAIPNWTLKYKVKVMCGVKYQGPKSYWSISSSIQVNQTNRYWSTDISKFELENSRSRSWLGQKSRPYSGSNSVSIHISLVPCQWDYPFLRYAWQHEGQNKMY